MPIKVTDVRMFPICKELAFYNPAFPDAEFPMMLSDSLVQAMHGSLELSGVNVAPVLSGFVNFKPETQADAKMAAGEAKSKLQAELNQVLSPFFGDGYDEVYLPYDGVEGRGTYVYFPTSNRHETITRVMLRNSANHSLLKPLEVTIRVPDRNNVGRQLIAQPLLIIGLENPNNQPI